MRQIIQLLPSESRQSALFSATQTTKVKDLARVSLRPGPLYINVHQDLKASTVSKLEQGYVVCDSDRRFLLLFTFLKKNLGKKIIVFMSSCNGVKYHSELLNYVDVPVLDLHVSCFLSVLFTFSLPSPSSSPSNLSFPSPTLSLPPSSHLIYSTSTYKSTG